ncbi:MAG: PAS domain S-box protein [Bacteroidota bacterium]
MSIPYQQFYQLSDTPMCVLDSQGKFESLNAAFMQLIGDNGEVKKHLEDWWLPKERPLLKSVLQSQSQVARTIWATLVPSKGRPAKMQWQIVHLPNTDHFFVEAHAWASSLLRSGEGDPLVPQDLRDNLKATHTLITFQELISDAIHKLADSLSDANYVVALHDPETAEYVYVSPGIEELVGFKASTLYGKTPYSFFHEGDLSKLAHDHRNKQKGEDPNQTLKFRRRMPDGNYRMSESVSRPVTDHEGNVIFIVSITRDAEGED